MYFLSKTKHHNHKRNNTYPIKTIIIGVLVLIAIISFVLILFFQKPNQLNQPNVKNFLELYGEEVVTIYEGDNYIDPGYNAYNSKKENLNKNVIIESNINLKQVGEYEIIYKLGNIIKKRKVLVLEKKLDEIDLVLKTIDDSVDLYLLLGTEYVEPGYIVLKNGEETNDIEVNITGKVNTNQKGSYEITYSVINSENKTISKKRIVNVLDFNINLSVSTKDYTNKDVTVTINVEDELFDYIIMPNGNKINKSSYTYTVTENGNYTFKAYNQKGMKKEQTITINNIDKTAPTGSCNITYNNGTSVVKVSHNDNIAIEKYVYNNKSYYNNSFNLSHYVDNVKITIYDVAGNTKEISCQGPKIPTIQGVSHDGVIVTVKAKKANSNIKGYYFSYSPNFNKQNLGYVSTSNSSIEVVRLPGTTYVWVEDTNGYISQPVSITLSNDVLIKTLYNSQYTVLKGTPLGSYLINKGWSIDEFNKLLFRSVRAAGFNTKEGAATASTTLIMILAQKYKIKLPYWQGGKTQTLGIESSWGKYRENPTYQGYYYYGMDCDGLVNWSYKNAGIVYSSYSQNHYYYWDGITYNANNGEVGDILRRTNHVNIIIAKDSSGYIVAEAFNDAQGIVINKYPYSDTSGYTIIKGERLFEAYSKISASEYPSGF